MLPYLTSYYGNPHSRTHAYGWETEAAVEHARKQVANLIGADPKEIIFTSGATESNNIAVKGVARFYKMKKKHIITTQTVTNDKIKIKPNFYQYITLGTQMCVGFLSRFRNGRFPGNVFTCGNEWYNFIK